MTGLGGIDLVRLQLTLKQSALDGWLVFDFHGINPIAGRLMDTGPGLGFTRRLFVWFAQNEAPTILVHTIDSHLVPKGTEVQRYNTWEDLHASLERIVRGKRIAMEISPDDAVPYLDRVPAGVMQLLTRLGADVVPSDELVSQFAAQWTDDERATHRRIAETLADIARSTLREVVGLGSPVTEFGVQRRVLEAIERAGYKTDSPPIVAFGVNGANAHHEPSEHANVSLEAESVVLLDLWARAKDTPAWADQTWMGYAGGSVPRRVGEVWAAVRDARDQALRTLENASSAGKAVSGADLDDAARGLLAQRGFAQHFVHRTGHSIDRELHGSGPHLDNFETHDIRHLVPGIAFSVEPGVYLPGEFGVRSEVNVLLTDAGPEVTPHDIQRELIRAT